MNDLETETNFYNVQIIKTHIIKSPRFKDFKSSGS